MIREAGRQPRLLDEFNGAQGRTGLNRSLFVTALVGPAAPQNAMPVGDGQLGLRLKPDCRGD
jgi:hypothetical protein